MILAISNNKGGVGKSTAVSMLSSILYQKGKRVLIVDTDNQGNAALAFGINPDTYPTTTYDALMGRKRPEDCIYAILENSPTDELHPDACIHIMPAHDAMAMFEFEVLTDATVWDEKFEFLRRVLAPIAHQYDVILIDTPPNVGLTIGNVLTAADGVLVPFQPERFSMRSLTKILEQIKEFRQMNDRLQFIGLFPVLVDKRTKLHLDVIEQAREYAEAGGFTMYETMIPRTIRFASAVSYNQKPLALVDPNDPLVQLYADLWAEIEKRSATVEAN